MLEFVRQCGGKLGGDFFSDLYYFSIGNFYTLVGGGITYFSAVVFDGVGTIMGVVATFCSGIRQTVIKMVGLLYI